VTIASNYILSPFRIISRFGSFRLMVFAMNLNIYIICRHIYSKAMNLEKTKRFTISNRGSSNFDRLFTIVSIVST